MASISISQSASARHDSRLRFRRQDDETDPGTTADEQPNADAYYDDNIEDDQNKDKNAAPGGNDNENQEDDPIPDDDAQVTTTTTTTKKPATKAAGGAGGSSDDVEYYDDDDNDNDDDEEGNQNSKEPNNVTQADTDEEATTPASPVQPGPSGQGQLNVVINPDVIQVQRGQTVQLTCIVYGGDVNTNIYWIQEEPERRYALTEPAGPNDKQVSGSQVTVKANIRLDDPTKIGKYTCMAQDASGNSGSALVTLEETGAGSGGYYPPPVYPPVVPGQSGASAYLRIVAPDMTDGDYVEIQCEGAAPEDQGSIQWYFNNKLLNDEQPLYPRGKTLHIRPISRAYLGNYRCSIPGSNYADANSVLTFGSGPAPAPAPAPVPVYPQPVQPSGARCNYNEATCRNNRCIPREYVCDGKDDCGDNSDESCGPPSGSGTDICQPNEIHCADPSRGRKCVQKFWMCDGDRDCDDGSDEEQRYCQLLPQQRLCRTSEFRCTGVNGTYGNPVCIPRSFQCDGYNDCPDRSDEVGCVKPTVVSPPPRQIQINAGETLTIQCSARGSPAPYINWRLNWGNICGDGYGNGRCTMTQAINENDPTLVTGTLTIQNVNANDAGAYSCEALNNQGFIFAIPDAIVNVVIEQGYTQPPVQLCDCNGHSTYCTPNGQCLNCQHNTAGNRCEYCAPGYQGDARRGTPYDCQLVTQPPVSYCNPAGTYTDRNGRCVCKYNVQGPQCDQCKPDHFYLNPVTPNGCLPCFCSGVTKSCTSTSWRRKPVALPLNNWNAVPKNFATNSYEAGKNIKQVQGGNAIALDQNSLGRPADEVLYWKAPKNILGDFVTLYDGTIDVHFTNDANGNQPTDQEYLWLRGNNIDLVHKIPQTQNFNANSNATYSVPVNEKTFTRKDGTFIDRENILMALSDLDTLLIKINPIGGKKNAVLRGVTLNPATSDGYTDAAPTVESCNCPANYTGTSCEKCAQGYGRPRPTVGIYLGQCWSCQSLCNERSNQCDPETGVCSNCQGNTEGDRCERCVSGYVLDSRTNQCVPGTGYQPYPTESSTRSNFYIDQKPYDSTGGAPLTINLNPYQSEQRIPLQVLNVQPQSVVWGRTDGSPLPNGVFQDGNDLVFRNPSPEQTGNYISTITHPDGFVEHINIYVNYPGGQPGFGLQPLFSPPSPFTINEGSSQLIQPPNGYYGAQWTRAGGQPFPSGIVQNGNALQIVSARPNQSGTYNCLLTGTDGSQVNVPYEIRVLASDRPQPVSGGPPKISIQPKVINLKEGQRMIVQYTVASQEPIQVTWNKLTNGVYQPIPSLFTVEPSRLVLNRATPDAAGTYQVVVSNTNGVDKQDLTINVEPRRSRQRGSQPQIRLSQDQYSLAYGQTVDIVPNIYNSNGATITWTKDGSQDLPDGVTALQDGFLRIQALSNGVAGQYNLDVSGPQGQASKTINVQWLGTGSQQQGYSGENGQDGSRSYVDVRLQSTNEQSHQVGNDINLQCTVQGSVDRPYEFTYTKDGQPLQNNVEVHPDGVLIIRNAQQSDAGRYLCEVNFPRAPEFGTQQTYYDLQIQSGSSGAGYDQGYQYGGGYSQQSGYVEVTVEPGDVNIEVGQKANATCVVKGAQQYKVTWGKYAHDTSLPTYANQEGNSVIIAPTQDSPTDPVYLQCQVDVPGQPQPFHAYLPVNIRGGDQSSKKKKKRRS